MSQHCHPCDISFRGKKQYDTHLETSKHRHLVSFLEQPKYIQTIEELKKRNEEHLKTIEELNKRIGSLECQLDNKDKANMRRLLEQEHITTRCAMLEQERDHLLGIANKPAAPVTINQTNYKMINKILNVISPEAIDYKSVRDYITAELASNGPECIAKVVHDKLLMDSDGKPKVVCSDPSRNKFKIKDPDTGNIVDDVNLEHVKSSIRNHMDFERIKEDALRVAKMNVSGDEQPHLLATKYIDRMRLKGRAGRLLSNLLHKHYVGTAKVKFDDDQKE